MSEKMMDKGTVMQTGACKFCGQSQIFETIGEATEEQLTEWATEKCSCGEAKEMMEAKQAEEKAYENIKKLFGEYDAGAILKQAVHSVAICAVESVTVNVGNGVKGVLTLGNNGKVKIKKSTTTVSELEA